MHYIPTSDGTVELLRKQAKKLQRERGGKHTELLDQVAKQANYHHWHHVIECNGRGKAAAGLAELRQLCEAIIAAELRGEVRIVETGPEIAVDTFVLFSTGTGDAWLLDPNEQFAMCLVLNHTRIAPSLRVDPTEMSIGFHAMYELRGDFFYVESEVPSLDTRIFGGYPLEALRPILERAKPNFIKLAETIGQFETVEMTSEVMQQMGKKGYTEAMLLQLKAEGYRYSPSRDSLLGPVMSGDSDDFQDSDHP